jgi:hypothetical protein
MKVVINETRIVAFKIFAPKSGIMWPKIGLGEMN